MRRTHSTRLFVPATLLVAAFALAGCAAASPDYTTTTEQGAPAGGNDSAISSDSGGGIKATDGTASDVDRQVITTGWMTIVVDNPRSSATDAIKIAESAGGRVDGRSEYAPVPGDKGSATLTLRLPAKDLSETLDKLGQLGEVREISLNSSDVTVVTQDLDARISALSASVDRLLELLKTATDTDTLIQLETAISDRQAQLESLESERRYYADQVSLSTITVSLVTVADVPVQNPDTFLTGVVAGWNAFVAFFSGLLVALGVLLPWLIFAGIITAVVIWMIKRRQAKAAAAKVEPVTATPTTTAARATKATK